MSNIAIEFENVGKMYRLGRVGTGTLSHDLNRWWQMSVLGKEDPFLKIGQTNDRTQKGTSDYVWALRDINFKVEQGEVLGIIGKNGAGKSTLLKLLSNITSPSTGKIKYSGRIASLLEVGTGFHPEMTGRENIYMNGAIMGMTKREITAKLDEIVDFAGVERYLDTPVKRYSSGMTVRLGFAVAAFLEPEILVVDEVLTVGDAEFQKRAIGKMQDVSRGEGRTVLFVSHNMATVKSLCKQGIVLNNGALDYLGSAQSCVDHYLENNISSLSNYCDQISLCHDKSLARELEILKVEMMNDPNNVSTAEPLLFELTISNSVKLMNTCQIGIVARNSADVVVWSHYTSELFVPSADTFKVKISIPNHNTAMGRYRLNFNISKYDYTAVVRNIDIVYAPISFNVNYVDEEHKRPFSLWPFQSGTSIQYSTTEIAVI